MILELEDTEAQKATQFQSPLMPPMPGQAQPSGAPCRSGGDDLATWKVLLPAHFALGQCGEEP